MECSHLFGFLKILSESNKVVLKNAKSMAIITTLSLLPSSILFLLFSYLYQSAINSITNYNTPILPTIIYFTLLFSLQLTFLLAYIAITHASGIAAILASVASYSDTKLSLQDLYSSFRSKWQSPMRGNLRGSRTLMSFLCILAVALPVPAVIIHPNPVTVTVGSVVVASIFVYLIYNSIVPALAGVIRVVEDGCEAAEALEKAEKLVGGQKLHGFMVSLWFNVMWLIVLVSLWMIVGDKGKFNLMVYGLFFVNSASLEWIFTSVVHTVYYFRCMEYHGQKIQVQLLGSFH